MCVKFDFDTTMANPATFYSVLVAIQKILAGDFTVAVLLIHCVSTLNSSDNLWSTVYTQMLSIMMNCLPHSFPNGYVQLDTP